MIKREEEEARLHHEDQKAVRKIPSKFALDSIEK